MGKLNTGGHTFKVRGAEFREVQGNFLFTRRMRVSVLVVEADTIVVFKRLLDRCIDMPGMEENRLCAGR